MNQSTLLIKSRRKTKQIVSMEVTKEDVADGTYDSKDNFRYVKRISLLSR
ncbi:MAG: hypothetical protein WCF03_08590 [Nitrososphaeraceae archaeon]|jgi:hypothetical protein